MKTSPITILGKPVYLRVSIEVTEGFKTDYQRYSKTPLEVGKFIQLDVMPDDVKITHPVVQFETEQQCVIACDNHNRFWGWTNDEKVNILYRVLSLLDKIQLKAVAFLFLLLFSFVGRAQECVGREPMVAITSACNGSVCLKNTYNIGTSYCSWFVVNATGATSYVWSDATGVVGNTAAYSYSPSIAGVTSLTVLGSVTYSDGVTCTATAGVNLTAVVCDFLSTVGIESYELNEGVNPVYFDLQGNVVVPVPGMLVIEKKGVKVRKVVVCY